jgi:nicotinamide-nucleotide amidase
MRAYILSIGSELIHGHLTDTNATFLAQELAALGIELLHVVQVGDARPRIAATIARGLEEADLVVCTGGVGPTEDDLTREAIADVMGETPIVDDALVEDVRAFFVNRGVPMPERNKKQAWLIPSAIALTNPVGTAPGWFAQREGKIVVAMPGVPREMFRMWREQVRPRLLERMPQQVMSQVTLKTIGIGESAAEQELGDAVLGTNPVIATYAKDDGVHIRVTGYGRTAVEADAHRAAGRAIVAGAVGDFIYGEDATTLDGALLALAAGRGITLGIVDAGGGGRFASLLAMSPTCFDRVALAELTRPGDDTAAALATRALLHARVTLGIGITVQATPADLDLWQGEITVATRGVTEVVETFRFKSPLPELQRRSGMVAADVVRRAILGIPAR